MLKVTIEHTGENNFSKTLVLKNSTYTNAIKKIGVLLSFMKKDNTRRSAFEFYEKE